MRSHPLLNPPLTGRGWLRINPFCKGSTAISLPKLIRHQMMKNDAYGIERCHPLDDPTLLCILSY